MSGVTKVKNKKFVWEDAVGLVWGARKLSKAARTLYVHRKLRNGDDVRRWAASQGIESTLPADDMHVTVAFSRTPVDWSSLRRDTNGLVVAHVGQRALHQFPARTTPNGAVVLKFSSDGLEQRWQEFRDAGASWDFPAYQPHVTLTYSIKAADLDGLEPYVGPLVFGPEEFSEVSDDWAAGIEEVPT